MKLAFHSIHHRPFPQFHHHHPCFYSCTMTTNTPPSTFSSPLSVPPNPIYCTLSLSLSTVVVFLSFPQAPHRCTTLESTPPCHYKTLPAGVAGSHPTFSFVPREHCCWQFFFFFLPRLSQNYDTLCILYPTYFHKKGIKSGYSICISDANHAISGFLSRAS